MPFYIWSLDVGSDSFTQILQIPGSSCIDGHFNFELFLDQISSDYRWSYRLKHAVPVSIHIDPDVELKYLPAKAFMCVADFMLQQSKQL